VQDVGSAQSTQDVPLHVSSNASAVPRTSSSSLQQRPPGGGQDVTWPRNIVDVEKKRNVIATHKARSTNVTIIHRWFFQDMEEVYTKKQAPKPGACFSQRRMSYFCCLLTHSFTSSVMVHPHVPLLCTSHFAPL
jgi:hypothetical protein